jgi:hypothetical protein
VAAVDEARAGLEDGEERYGVGERDAVRASTEKRQEEEMVGVDGGQQIKVTRDAAARHHDHDVMAPLAMRGDQSRGAAA